MLNIGDKLQQGRYRVNRQLAAGGMGAVYEVFDRRLQTTFALKVAVLHSAEEQAQFEREAQLLAQLDHPVLPRVLDHFGERGLHFLVMDLVPGDDLEGLLAQQRHPFDVALVLQWADQLLDALEYLHSQQLPIIHRDIKPANLKLTNTGRIKLLDFGIAKQHVIGSQTVTVAKAYSLEYSPLEQFSMSTHTDVRSDVYSLGATLYHLLTNHTPPSAPDRARGQPLPPPQTFNPACPPALVQAILRAMALKPEQRFQNASEFRAALQHVRDELSSVTQLASGRKQMLLGCGKWIFILALVSIIGLVSLSSIGSQIIDYSFHLVQQVGAWLNARWPWSLLVPIAVALVIAAVALYRKSIYARAISQKKLPPAQSTLLSTPPTTSCPSCGSPNVSNAAFCDNCGVPLTTVASSTTEGTQRFLGSKTVGLRDSTRKTDDTFCDQCGSRVVPGEVFCDTCGAKLDTLTASSVHASPAPLREPCTSRLILNQRTHDSISRFKSKTFEDFVLYKSYERFWRHIAFAEGGRYILTGYERFGGTSLVKCAVEKARSELQDKGALLVFYFEVAEESIDGFRIKTNNFVFDHLGIEPGRNEQNSLIALKHFAEKRASTQSLEFTLSSPIELSFGTVGKVLNPQLNKSSALNRMTDFILSTTMKLQSAHFFIDRTPSQQARQESAQFLAELKDFFENRGSSEDLQRVILDLTKSKSFPSRIIMIVDKIKYFENLDRLLSFNLFTRSYVSVVVVTRKEDFDRWYGADKRLEETGFSEWYVPCLWEMDLIQILFDPIEGPLNNKAQIDRFIKHLAYIGRGSLGRVINKLKRAKNITYGPDFSLVDIDTDDDEILHNSWMQDVLNLNWNMVLGNLFAGKNQVEREDRARLGIYCLLDIICKRNRFSIEELLGAAQNKMSIGISEDVHVSNLVIENLLHVLIKNNYLKKEDDRYNVTWNKNNPSKPHRVRKVQPPHYRDPKTIVPGASTDISRNTGDVIKPDQSTKETDGYQKGEVSTGSKTKILGGSNAEEKAEEIASLEEQRRYKTRRLNELRQQEAINGINTDPKIKIEIEDLGEEIRSIRQQLQQLREQT